MQCLRAIFEKELGEKVTDNTFNTIVLALKREGQDIKEGLLETARIIKEMARQPTREYMYDEKGNEIFKDKCHPCNPITFINGNGINLMADGGKPLLSASDNTLRKWCEQYCDGK